MVKSFKPKNPSEEMAETLKLIQQVTSSILDNQEVSLKGKVKPHVTRIANPHSHGPGPQSTKKK